MLHEVKHNRSRRTPRPMAVTAAPQGISTTAGVSRVASPPKNPTSTYVQTLALPPAPHPITRIPPAPFWYPDCPYPTRKPCQSGLPAVLSNYKQFSPGQGSTYEDHNHRSHFSLLSLRNLGLRTILRSRSEQHSFTYSNAGPSAACLRARHGHGVQSARRFSLRLCPGRSSAGRAGILHLPNTSRRHSPRQQKGTHRSPQSRKSLRKPIIGLSRFPRSQCRDSRLGCPAKRSAAFQGRPAYSFDMYIPFRVPTTHRKAFWWTFAITLAMSVAILLAVIRWS